MKEISDVLHISINTVKSRLLRGKDALKENLKGDANLNNSDKKISEKVKSYLDENVEFTTVERKDIQMKIKQNKSKKINPIYWTALASAAAIFLILSISF